MVFKLTLKARLAALISFLSLLCVCIGLLGLYGINSTHAGLKSVYEERTVGLEQISRIDRLLVQNQLALAEALQDSMDTTIKLKSQQIAKILRKLIVPGIITRNLFMMQMNQFRRNNL